MAKLLVHPKQPINWFVNADWIHVFAKIYYGAASKEIRKNIAGLIIMDVVTTNHSALTLFRKPTFDTLGL